MASPAILADTPASGTGPQAARENAEIAAVAENVSLAPTALAEARAAPAAPATGSHTAHSGWNASLALTFAARQGRTVLASRRHHGPLAVQKVLYPESRRDICHATLLHPPGGLASGDRLDIDITLESGSHAVITTPGATKWYKADPDRPASQQIRLRLAPHARLDWLVLENIYFARSQVRQGFELHLAEGATAMGWDATLLGRQASGERWHEATARTDSRIIGPDGRLLWLERQSLSGASPALTAPQGLDGLPAYGTLWACALACTPELAERLAPDLPHEAGLRSAVTCLPGNLLLVRAASWQIEPIRQLFAGLWLRLRETVHGVPGEAPRLWAT